MVKVKPFQGYLSNLLLAPKILAPPYDVVNTKEAQALAKGNQYSFLHVNKPEIDLPDSIDEYSEQVYQKGKENLDMFIKNDWLQRDTESRYYIYAQTMNQRTQFGLVAACSIEDYESDKIKKHEKTLKRKEENRTRMTDAQNASIEPVFLTYQKGEAIQEKISDIVQNVNPFAKVTSADEIVHTLWQIDGKENKFFEEEFKKIDTTYIADGHHRSAAAYNVGKMRRDEALSKNGKISGEEDFNYFMSILYPTNQLRIMDYNRVLKSLNNHTPEQFLKKIEQWFTVAEFDNQSLENVRPRGKHYCSLYINHIWYALSLKPEFIPHNDPVKSLDVQILNDTILEQVCGITDIRNDKRIDFVGGIRGLLELKKRCSEDCVAAFAMHPVEIEDLLKVADAGMIMPPKSTWFEPKPRSGFVVRVFDQ